MSSKWDSFRKGWGLLVSILPWFETGSYGQCLVLIVYWVRPHTSRSASAADRAAVCYLGPLSSSSRSLDGFLRLDEQPLGQ